MIRDLIITERVESHDRVLERLDVVGIELIEFVHVPEDCVQFRGQDYFFFRSQPKPCEQSDLPKLFRAQFHGDFLTQAMWQSHSGTSLTTGFYLQSGEVFVKHGSDERADGVGGGSR